jgi:hypothetical protein
LVAANAAPIYHRLQSSGGRGSEITRQGNCWLKIKHAVSTWLGTPSVTVGFTTFISLNRYCKRHQPCLHFARLRLVEMATAISRVIPGRTLRAQTERPLNQMCSIKLRCQFPPVEKYRDNNEKIATMDCEKLGPVEISMHSAPTLLASTTSAPSKQL